MKWQCTACGMKFGGITGFDAHRFGKGADVHPHYGRRCLTLEEMGARGYVPRDDGTLVEPMPDDVLRLRRRSEASAA